MSDELLQYVREVGQQLRVDLERAAAETQNWGQPGKSLKLVTGALDQCLASLSATGIEGPDNRLPSTALWQTAGDLLQFGDLQFRARTKPAGYAGDDELLRRIYEGQVARHPLGRAMDQYFLRQDAPQAVRQRMKIAGSRLAKHASGSARPEYRMISIGSGPAIDIELALTQQNPEQRKGMQIELLDLDPEALQRAEQRVTAVAGEHAVTARRENLFRLARRAPRADADFVLGLGLFDYLEDEKAIELLTWMWSRLREGGELSIGNFSPACHTRPYMEWVGNWYLQYRDGSRLERLATTAGIPSEAVSLAEVGDGAALLLTARRGE